MIIIIRGEIRSCKRVRPLFLFLLFPLFAFFFQLMTCFGYRPDGVSYGSIGIIVFLTLYTHIDRIVNKC